MKSAHRTSRLLFHGMYNKLVFISHTVANVASLSLTGLFPFVAWSDTPSLVNNDRQWLKFIDLRDEEERLWDRVHTTSTLITYVTLCYKMNKYVLLVNHNGGRKVFSWIYLTRWRQWHWMVDIAKLSWHVYDEGIKSWMIMKSNDKVREKKD